MGIAKDFEVRVNGVVRKISTKDGVMIEDLQMYIHCIHDAYTVGGCTHATEFLEEQKTPEGIIFGKPNWREADGWTIVSLANSKRDRLWKAYCKSRGIDYDAQELCVWQDKSYLAANM